MSTKKSFLKGVGYIAIAKYSSIIIGLIITSILARILSPNDFGMIAIATVFIVFFSLLSDMGISPAIIQFKNLTKEDLSSIFGFTFWIALLSAFTFFFVSPLVAQFYSESKLINICRILSLQIFFSTINIVPQALLLREKKFNIVALRNVSIQILCGIIAVIWAYKAGSIYALLVSPVLGAFFSFLVNVMYMKLKIKFLCSMSSIRKISSYSFYQFMFNFVNYFGRNLDKLIIGKTISIASLGYYEKSYRLMMMPVQNINGVIDPVLLPYLSDYQNDINKIYGIYNKMTKILLNVGFIVSGVLFMCSSELVLIVFGDQWEPAVACFRILTLSVASQIVAVSTGSILQACNQTKLLFKLGVINVVIALIGLIISAFGFGTIEAVSIAFVVTSYISTFNSYFAVYHYCFRTNMRHLFAIAIKPVIILAILVLLSISVSNMEHKEYPLLLSMVIKLLLCSVISFIYLIKFTDYQILGKIRNFINKR